MSHQTTLPSLSLIENIEIRNDLSFLSCNYESNPDLIERAREFVQLQYSKLGYVGYDPEFDRQFDLNGYSRYFIAVNHSEEIVATSRVLTRGPFGLPIEYSLRNDTNEKTILENGNIAEMNSFAASSMAAGSKVLSYSTDFLLEQGFSSTYGLYDIERPAMGKLYNRIGAVHSELHPYKIYFPSYGKVDHGSMTPTIWGIQVSDVAKIIAKKSHK
ncbi:hypothetical protein AB3N59_05595 [Leptospira sp. WS92.C1]